MPQMTGPQMAQMTRILLLAGALLAVAGCRAEAPAVARSTAERAAARAYDGAPPTIPHAIVGECATCHDDDGSAIEGVGVSPASPHGQARMAGDMRRCRQCHVPAATSALFVPSRFNGLPQGPWRGGRFYEGAPPTIPHRLQLREHCLACHAGPAARADLRTTHPERTRCGQCHVPQ
jgi:cytochrome c-type protein NapB